MPVFNAEKYLKSAITSILTQTYKNLELFVINDCSNDGSMKIISSFNDHRVKIISNSRNLGISFSLNKGIDASKGKYIARLDADDISHLDRLKISSCNPFRFFKYTSKNCDELTFSKCVEIFCNFHLCLLMYVLIYYL